LGRSGDEFGCGARWLGCVAVWLGRIACWFDGVAFAGGLDAAEDGGDLTLELGEVEIDDRAAGMQDDVDGRGEERERGADGLAEAALDAVAVDGLAEGFGDGEADAWAGGVGSAVSGTERVEVGELLRELLAAGFIDELVVGVFAQTMSGLRDRRGGHGRRTTDTKTRAGHKNALRGGSTPVSALVGTKAKKRD